MKSKQLRDGHMLSTSSVFFSKILQLLPFESTIQQLLDFCYHLVGTPLPTVYTFADSSAEQKCSSVKFLSRRRPCLVPHLDSVFMAFMFKLITF